MRAPTPCSTPGRRSVTANCSPPLLFWVMDSLHWCSETKRKLPEISSGLTHFLCKNVMSTFPADPVGGTINVKNASASASGTYRCTASNRVGTETCFMQLKVTPREYPSSFMLRYSGLLLCSQAITQSLCQLLM